MKFNYRSFPFLSPLLVASLTLLICGLTLEAQAEIRIATIDMSKVLQESPSAKQKLKAIDSKASEAKKSIEARKQALVKRQAALEGKEDSSKEALELRKTARELQRFIADTEEELKEEMIAVRQEITSKAFATVRNFAEENGIDLVLEKNDARTGPVLFANNAADITKDVIKVMK
jgi:outer membrane protein